MGGSAGRLGFAQDCFSEGLSFLEECAALLASTLPLQQGREEGHVHGGLEMRSVERSAVDVKGFAEEAFGASGMPESEFGFGGDTERRRQVRMGGRLNGAAHVNGGAGQQQGSRGIAAAQQQAGAGLQSAGMRGRPRADAGLQSSQGGAALVRIVGIGLRAKLAAVEDPSQDVGMLGAEGG